MLGASAGKLEPRLMYSRKMWQELNLADCPKPARTKILVDFNLADNQARPRHTPALGACPRTTAWRDTTSTGNMECELAMDSCIRGHRVFKNIWTPAMGKQLPCRREIGNNKDWYTVAILRDCTTVGHVPRKISAACALFLQREGSIHCVVTRKLLLPLSAQAQITENSCYNPETTPTNIHYEWLYIGGF